MEKFLSTYGHPTSALDTLEKVLGLKELAHEFCTAFGVKITHNKVRLSKCSSVDVVDNNGFPLGQLQIGSNSSGDKYYTYECEGLIKKQKSSANSGQSARDSTKISGLIKALKKNGEHPKAEGCMGQFKATITYGFGAMDNNRLSSTINLDRSKFIGIAYEILGVENHGYQIDRAWIQEVVDAYNKDENKKKQGKMLLERFGKGMTVIRLPSFTRGEGGEDFYLIGKATYDINTEKVATIGDFIRYDSISDTPYAGLAVMCKTYMARSKHGSTDDNVFGIGRGDSYISDLDITNCYGGSTHLLLIPDNAE